MASIRSKIIWGYALALGIATGGTLVGFAVGNHYQQQATQAQAIAAKEQNLLSDLQVSILQRRPAKELLPFIRDPLAFDVASQHLLDRLNHTHTLLAELQAQEQMPAIVARRAQLKDYQATVDSLYQQLEAIVQQIQPRNQTPEQAQVAERLVLDLVGSPTFAAFIQFSDELTSLIAQAQHRETTAQLALQQAERLRTQIILLSMALSVIVAAGLALYTSRAIARPIESLTAVAQQVTQTANFQLQAPITTQDEVGTLATSINQMIQWVATYTMELKETQAQLIQTEKMSSLGQMVAGVAHEINNPVNFIYGNLNHASDYLADLMALIALYQHHYPAPVPEIREKIEEIDLEFLIEDLSKMLSSMQVGTERIQQLVVSLRNFSRLDEAEMKEADLHEGLDSTLLLLNHRLKNGISVTRHYGNLPHVRCYPAQLNQVFMNLLSNAIDALFAQPNADETDKTIQIETEVVADDRVQIRIRDNGPGIPESVKQRIFDPFFTTKPVGQGTGLGLSICYQIIQRHQGKIEVVSAPDEGTEFKIQLPITTTAWVS